MKIYPDKDKTFPNPATPGLCYIKNVVENPMIILGDDTYCDDIDGAGRFEEHHVSGDRKKVYIGFKCT